MSNVIRSYPETLTNKQRYLLTMSNRAQRVKDCEGQTVEVAAWALYQDTDSKGIEKTLLSILTVEGDVLSTVSPTFQKDFLNMVEAFGEEFRKIHIVSGQSKNGRSYFTCEYAE